MDREILHAAQTARKASATECGRVTGIPQIRFGNHIDGAVFEIVAFGCAVLLGLAITRASSGIRPP
jgi:hypothetical protein